MVLGVMMSVAHVMQHVAWEQPLVGKLEAEKILEHDF